MRPAPVLAVAASVALGVLSEASGPMSGDPVLWVPDLLVGWTCLASAIVAWRRRAPGAATLLAATGVTWFLGITPETLYLHRGPLVHLLLTYPGWRPPGRVYAVAIGVGYVAAVVPGLWGAPAGAVLLSLGLVILTAARALPSGRPGGRRGRYTALAGSALFAAGVLGAALVPLAVGPGAVLPLLLAYQASVVVTAVLLVVGLPQRSPAGLADAVVDLAEQPDVSLRQRLASALADPTIEVAYWSPTTRDYRTDTGVVVDPDQPGPGRAVVVVAREARPFVAVVHDTQSLRDPRLVDAVTRAVRLSDTNAALRAQVEQVYWQVFDSRRRLVVAADEERRRLDTRLQDGPERLLRQLEEDLAALDDCHDEAVARAREHCRQAQVDLRRLSRGLHPRELDDGLIPAVVALARRQPGRIDVQVDSDAFPASLTPDLEATAYFVVAEALANVAKHAGGDLVRIGLWGEPGWLCVSVCDDGVGGATAAAGTGLQGLADRVEARGGRFAVHSPLGAGTRVTAELPAGGR